jgi:hypothetical protein
MSSYKTTQAGQAYFHVLNAVKYSEDDYAGYTASYTLFSEWLRAKGYKLVDLEGNEPDAEIWKDEDNFMRSNSVPAHRG